METLRPYKPGQIEPVVQAGQNLLVVDRTAFRLYGVAFIEPIPLSHPFVIDAGPLGAGASTPVVSTQNVLDMQYGELAQYRARVLDDVHVIVRQPSALQRFGAKNINATINAFTHLDDRYDSMSEMFIFEDQRMFLVFTNPTAYPLLQARIAFYGFRYVLSGREGVSNGEHITALKAFNTIEEAKASGEKFTVVPMGGWGR